MSVAAIVTRGLGSYARTESIAKRGFSNYVNLPEPPASGTQYTLLDEPGGGWDSQSIPYGQTPAVVDNDILITPLLTSGGYTVVPGADGILIIDTGGDSSRQLLVGVDIYDISLLALYGAVTFAINDLAPSVTPLADTIVLRQSQAMTAQDLAGQFAEPELDAITYAVTSGSPPTGTSVDAAGQWTGTPTTVSTGSFVLTGTDPYNATGTLTVTWAVVNQVAVPDVDDTGTAEGDALAAIAALFLVGASTYQFSATVPAGEVISQSPAATTLVDPGSTVILTVSLGDRPVVVLSARPSTTLRHFFLG